MIICGDAGFMWNNTRETKYWDDWTEDRPFTTICCFGNHCNFPAIRALPTERWNGSIVRKVRPHIMYVENGEILTINNKKFFFMGGAISIDKIYRVEGKTWFSEEIPSNSEMWNAVNNLNYYNNQVDYIITHCAPNSILDQIARQFIPDHDAITNFLEKNIKQEIQFKDWFLGHYHINETIDKHFHILYRNILEILPNGELVSAN